MDTWKLAPCLLTLGEAGGKYLELNGVEVYKMKWNQQRTDSFIEI
eukprot:COSAG02_NODE_1663_length_11442_cov_757.870316_7_plen_45_part_00